MKTFPTNIKVMFRRRTCLTLVSHGFFGALLACSLVVPSIAFSQWSGSPTVNNPLSIGANDRINPASVGDGAGGAIIVWQDKRSGSNVDIYAQRVNANGDVQWTANGVAICSADSDQVSPAIVRDGNGGAIIAWQDKRSGSYDIYAQRVNAAGALQWSPSTGVPVCTAAFDQVNIAMVSDGNGGALLTWEDYREQCRPGLRIFIRRSLTRKAYRSGLQTGSVFARKQPRNMVRRSSVTEAVALLLRGMINAQAIMTSMRSG